MLLTRLLNKLSDIWMRFWITFAGTGLYGRFFTRLAVLFIPPYYERHRLALLTPKGYFAPSSRIYGKDISCGKHVFLDDRVLIYQGWEGRSVSIEDGVHLHRDTVIQTGQTGSVKIGTQSKVQLRCQFSAYKGSIFIGSEVQIGPNCSFFPYNHAVALGTPIRKQPLQSKGDIVVGDGVWIGVGVTILDGVTIGQGAVIGAGSVVTTDIPENAIAAGVPATIKKYRS